MRQGLRAILRLSDAGVIQYHCYYLLHGRCILSRQVGLHHFYAEKHSAWLWEVLLKMHAGCHFGEAGLCREASKTEIAWLWSGIKVLPSRPLMLVLVVASNVQYMPEYCMEILLINIPGYKYESIGASCHHPMVPMISLLFFYF